MDKIVRFQDKESLKRYLKTHHPRIAGRVPDLIIGIAARLLRDKETLPSSIYKKQRPLLDSLTPGPAEKSVIRVTRRPPLNP
jgi:hypothetical protein